MSRRPAHPSDPPAPVDSRPDLEAAPPMVVPEAGWTPVEPPSLEGGRGSFVSGEPGGGRLRVAYFRRPEDDHLVGRAWFGPGAEGPPSHAHGGAISAVLDEAMGAAAWLAGLPVVAGRLEVDFRRMLPLGTDAVLEAWVAAVEGRKVTARGRLADDHGQSFAEASGLFVILDAERFRQQLGSVAKSLELEPEELLERMRSAVISL